MKTSSPTPLYLQVADELRSQIHASKWAAGAKLPPEPAFARQFGTSRQTFRKALSILVKQGMIEQRKGKGTFVTHASRHVATKVRLGVVGILSGSIGRDPYWSPLIGGIEEGLARSGEFELVLMGAMESNLVVHRNPQVSGLFIVPTFLDALRIAGPDLNTIPHVCLCVSLPQLRRHNNIFVDADNFTAGVNVMDYLAGLGHRKIACIHASLTRSNRRDRLQGFQAGAEKHGIPPELIRIHGIGATLLHGIRATLPEQIAGEIRTILEDAERPTAIFAMDHKLAFGVMTAAQSLGLRIPDDLSLVGFDDYETGALASPPLTTVRQPVRAMAVQAGELMALQLAHKPLKSRQVILQTELIVRQSCRATAPDSEKR